MSYSSEFKITTARFANVAFSNGSLLDGYINRLMQRQPISCPSDVKRFFVSPEESGQICLLACILGNSGDIFFPKLCEDQLVNFKEITENFFEFLGIHIEYCNSEKEAKGISIKNIKTGNLNKYPVFFFESDTSGEKLYEEFYEENDTVNLTSYRQLGVITNSHKPTKEDVQFDILKLKQVFLKNSSDKASIVAELSSIITGFKHIETGKSLDQKM